MIGMVYNEIRPVNVSALLPALTETSVWSARMADDCLPHPDILRQLLSYDPDTGILVWKMRPLNMFSIPSKGRAWNTKNAGKEALTALNKGYRRGTIHGRHVFAHRTAWALHYGEWPSGEIDHINGNRQDNRLCNLRNVCRVENGKNLSIGSKNTSGVIGVNWNKGAKKWSAEIQSNGARMFLGLFDDVEKASIARLEAECAHGFHQNHGRNGPLK